jgi:hypothetical protein
VDDTDLSGDIAQCHRCEAVTRDQAECRVEDLPAAFGGLESGIHEFTLSLLSAWTAAASVIVHVDKR